MLLEKSFLWSNHYPSCYGQYTLSKDESSPSLAVPAPSPPQALMKCWQSYA